MYGNGKGYYQQLWAEADELSDQIDRTFKN
jgi:hypothetical protein